jgi:hypothetical protein
VNIIVSRYTSVSERKCAPCRPKQEQTAGDDTDTRSSEKDIDGEVPFHRILTRRASGQRQLGMALEYCVCNHENTCISMAGVLEI